MAAPTFDFPPVDLPADRFTPAQHRAYRALYVDREPAAIRAWYVAKDAAQRAASAAIAPAPSPAALPPATSTSSAAEAPSAAPAAKRHPREWTRAEDAAFRKQHGIAG